jgi:DoxX-like family
MQTPLEGSPRPARNASPAASAIRVWAGRIITALVALLLVFDAFTGIIKAPQSQQGAAHLGYPAGVGVWIGVALLTCTALYVIPRTSVLGAILLTGYLGGATASLVRIGDQFLFPVVFGVVVWVGIFLREGRLRALIPLRD